MVFLPLTVGEVCSLTRVEDDDDDDREPDDSDASEYDRLMLLSFSVSMLDGEVNGTILYPIFRARVFSSASDGMQEDAAGAGRDLTTAAKDF